MNEVYTVGEYCQYEGSGWSMLVADNEYAFDNIKQVLIGYHRSEIDRYKSLLDEDHDGHIAANNKGHLEIIDLINNADSIDDINNVEIPPWNQDVIRIDKVKIIGLIA